MQLQDLPQTTQPLTERIAYCTPKLARYGRLASLVEGGTISSAGESVIVVFS